MSFPAIKEKIYAIDYVPQDSVSILENVVGVYKQTIPFSIQKIISVTVHIFASLLTLTLVGALIWFPINAIKDASYQVDLKIARFKFQEKMKNRQAPPDILLLPPFIFKSDKRAANILNEYAIGSDQNIWYQRLSQNNWKPLFFDGELNGAKPVKITVDGTNLVVIDDRNEVHYCKVLIDGRGKKEARRLRFLPHVTSHERKNFEKVAFDPPHQNAYVVIDKTEKLNWKPMWYSFPVAHRIINLFTGKRLKVKEDFIISQRGRFTDYFTDVLGNNHKNVVGVTTGIQFDEENTSIQKFDPWAPKNAVVHIYFPQSKNKKFVGIKKDVSSSTIAVLGYEYDFTTNKKQLKLLINLCDIDTNGNNPAIKYLYDTNENPAKREKYLKKNRICLPDIIENEGWTEHIIPEELEIYDQISIFQTGAGNENREIRIAAKYQELEGYLTKKLSSDKWKFISKLCHNPIAIKLERELNFNPVGLSLTIKTPFTKYFSAEKMKVHYFGKHAYSSKIEYEYENNIYTLGLHKRLGLINFLFGLTKGYYQIIIPKDIPQNDVLVKAFGNRRVIPVKIKEFNEKGLNRLSLSIKGKHPKMSELKESV